MGEMGEEIIFKLQILIQSIYYTDKFRFHAKMITLHSMVFDECVIDTELLYSSTVTY